MALNSALAARSSKNRCKEKVKGKSDGSLHRVVPIVRLLAPRPSPAVGTVKAVDGLDVKYRAAFAQVRTRQHHANLV